MQREPTQFLSGCLLTGLWVQDRWRRRERRRRGTPAGRKADEKTSSYTFYMSVCVPVVLKLLPCRDSSCRTRSPADRSGTPRGISTIFNRQRGTNSCLWCQLKVPYHYKARWLDSPAIRRETWILMKQRKHDVTSYVKTILRLKTTNISH